MASNSRRISDYTFTSDDELIFDANIWLLIYAPYYLDPYNKALWAYSDAYKNIKEASSHLYIDVLVLSEYVNRYARLEYELARREDEALTFKAYRNSNLFKPVAEAIADYSRRILDDCEPIETGLSTVDQAAMLDIFEQGVSDFNDLMLALLCEKRNITLVTHDGDFQASGISILTCNTKLLK